MRTMLFAFALSTLLLAGCAHTSSPIGSLQATAPLFPAEAGAQQARRDLAAGLTQLMEAGTRGVWAPNVPRDDRRFILLPRYQLPSGCFEPDATTWIRYAEAYNKVVVAHVRNQSRR